MAELTAALDDALAGHGRLAMLVGEPGIGKTRLAQELVAVPEQRGARVLWGWSYEEAGAPPYWPWVQPIQNYIQQIDAQQLAAQMGPGAADITEIIPAARERLPQLEPLPSLEPEEARFRLFNSISTFLKNASGFQPLVLVLEDLHWADRSSLLLLEFLVRQLGTSSLLLIGTYRDVEVSRRHPLSQTLGNLIREEGFLRVQLAGLSQSDVVELIQSTTKLRPAPPLMETIHRRTEGNPLFVSEVVRILDVETLVGGRGSTAGIPEGVRDAIGRRLDRLSQGCN